MSTETIESLRADVLSARCRCEDEVGGVLRHDDECPLALAWTEYDLALRAPMAERLEAAETMLAKNEGRVKEIVDGVLTEKLDAALALLRKFRMPERGCWEHGTSLTWCEHCDEEQALQVELVALLGPE